MKKSRRRFLYTSIAGFGACLFEYFNLGTALAKETLFRHQPKVVVGMWRGLYIPTKITYDHNFIRILPSAELYQINGGATAFDVPADSQIFVQHYKEGELRRIYVRAIQNNQEYKA